MDVCTYLTTYLVGPDYVGTLRENAPPGYSKVDRRGPARDARDAFL